MIASLTNIGFYSYIVAFLAFFILTLLLVISSRGTGLGKRLIAASLLTCAWSLTAALLALQVSIPVIWVQSLELFRSLAWCYFLLGTIDSNNQDSALRAIPGWMLGLIVTVLCINTVALPGYSQHLAESSSLVSIFLETQLVSWVAVAIIGLLFTEQVFRNLNTDQRWILKYLCLGVGCVFTYDFFLYSNALLFKTLDPDLWASRGFINALAVPLIAVSVARNTKLDIGIHVSRDAVFHSVTLLGSGAYLMAMAGAGYYIRLYGGSWGSLLQAVFLAGAGVVLAILLFSDSIRRRLRVLLSKHFYSFKYDYREEWLRFTGNLANTSEPVTDRICHSIAAILHSSGAFLWCKNERDQFELINCWSWAEPASREVSDTRQLLSLVRFLDTTGWVVDVQEYRLSPEKYPDLVLPAWMKELPAWLIVPLNIEDKMIGFVLVKQANHMDKLNWEDHDLLKMAGQQAAILLAQHQSEQALIEARQFEAFNRLSAYTMHDLKNILAQQSLIISNAEKHKHKPAFIEDVLSTVANSVDRMTRLLEQMKRGERNTKTSLIDINELLNETITHHSKREPVPSLETTEPGITAEADRERLATVFGHLIQNAQEATPANGHITLATRKDGQNSVIEIRDSGSGMDTAFIRDRLFKPFNSTKGLTGMGIGAFESRNYIQSLGGNIQVESTPGAGSTFRITLPR